MTQHPIFGGLEQDESGEWVGSFALEDGNTVKLRLEADPFAQPAWAEQHGTALLERLHNEAALKREVCESLFELAQDWYQSGDDEDAELSLEQFVTLTRLSGVDLHADGSSMWWYEDGDVFAGHFIGAERDAAGVLEEANLHG